MPTIEQSTQQLIDQIYAKAPSANGSELVQMSLALKNISQEYTTINPSNYTKLNDTLCIDSVFIGQDGYYRSNEMQRCNQYSAGQYALAALEYANTATTGANCSRMTVYPFTVSQTTGSITMGTQGQVFENTSVVLPSRSANFGFNGDIGVMFGNCYFGTNASMKYGGAAWRVLNNEVRVGSTTENTQTNILPQNSNGYVNVFDIDGANTGVYIPTYNNSAQAAAVWVSISNTLANFTTPTNDSGYQLGVDSGATASSLIKCISKSKYTSLPGLWVAERSDNNTYLHALHKTTETSVYGTLQTSDLNRVTSGIGFELENGEEVYLSYAGDCYKPNATSAPLAATVTFIGVALNSKVFSDENTVALHNTGVAAEEADTFYITADNNLFVKVYITGSTGTYTVNVLGVVTLDSRSSGSSFGKYGSYIDVTGLHDDFIVVTSTFANNFDTQKTSVSIYPNPLRDL